jgi:flagellar motility protein MotE (MotC chaperone)
MSNQEETEGITNKQRIAYFVVVPLIFTSLLVGVGAVIVQQGKSATFSESLVKAGKSVVTNTESAVSSVTSSKKPASDTSAAGAANSGNNAAADPNIPSSNASGAAATDPSKVSPSATAPISSPSTLKPAPVTPPPPTADEQFKQKVDEVATEFSKMTPKQASAIISSMSTKDAVFTMVGMKATQRAGILSTMDPKQASIISKSLKDFPPDNKESADKVEAQLSGLPDTQQASEELIKTYNQMPAHSAALLITEVMKSNQKKAISITFGMDTAARAQMMSDLVSATKTNPEGVSTATIISENMAK